MSGILKRVADSISGPEYGLQGLWERYGDHFEGCTVLVRQGDKGVSEGSLTQLSKSMIQCGWQTGDIKWRSIRRIAKNRYELEDLFKEIDLDTKAIKALRYVSAEMKLKGNELILKCDPAADSSFAKQKWRRIGRF